MILQFLDFRDLRESCESQNAHRFYSLYAFVLKLSFQGADKYSGFKWFELL